MHLEIKSCLCQDGNTIFLYNKYYRQPKRVKRHWQRDISCILYMQKVERQTHIHGQVEVESKIRDNPDLLSVMRLLFSAF